MSRYSYLVGDLRTGRIASEVPILSPSWSAPINDAGTFSGELDLTDPDVADLNPRTLLEVGRTFLAVELDGVILYGGPLWAHRYSTAARRLRLAGAGLWSVFDHRKVIPALAAALTAPASDAADTVLTGLTLAGIARRLIAQAFAHTGGELPIVQPNGTAITVDPGTEAGSSERTYRGYDLSWLGDALRDLTNVDDGPDLELRPRRRADAPDHVEWVLRQGGPYLTQAGAPWTLEAGDVTNVDVDVDGTGLAFRGWATGAGSQRELTVERAEDLELVNAAGYPLLEAAEAHSTASDRDTLRAHASALVSLYARPVEAWTVEVSLDAELTPATYAAGDVFSVPVAGDPYLPDGEHLARCVAIGGNADALTLTMQPSDDADRAIVVPSMRVLTVGDSITYGIGASNPATTSWPARLPAALGAYGLAPTDVVVRNVGWSGSTTRDWVAKGLTDQDSAYRPTVVTIALGTNDYAQGIAATGEYATNLGALVDRYAALGATVVLIAPIPAQGRDSTGYRDAARQLATTRGLPFVDPMSRWGSYAAHPDWYTDGIHPTDAGYADLAQAIAAVLATIPTRRAA